MLSQIANSEKRDNLVVEAASVASTLLSPFVKEPKNYEQQFYVPVVEHFEDFFLLGYVGARNFLFEKFSKYVPIRYSGESRFAPAPLPTEEDLLKRKAFLIPDKKTFTNFLRAFCNEAKSIGSSHVKRIKDGFQISIPIGSINLSVDGITEIAKNYSSLDETNKKEMLKILHGMVKGTNFLDLSKKSDILISTKELLTAHEWFNVNAIPGVSNKTVKAFEQFVTGMRMISAPVPKHSAFNGDYNKELLKKLQKESGKEDVEAPPIYHVSQAEDKIAFLEHALDVRRVNLFLNLIIPTEYAKFITQTSNEKAINPAWIALWLMSMYKGNLDPSSSSRNRVAKAFTPLSSIRTANKNVIGTPTPMRNKELLSLDTEGKLLIIPDADSVDDYEKTFTSFGSNDKTGEFSLADPGKLAGNVFTFEETREEKQEAAKELPRDKLIYVDWINRKLAYSNSEGLMKIEDIEGYTVPTTFSIIKNLDKHVLGEEATEVLGHLAFALNHVEANFSSELEPSEIDSFVREFAISAYGIEILKRALESRNIKNLLDEVSDVLSSSEAKNDKVKDKLSELDAANGMLKLKHLAENSPIYPLRAVGRLLKKSYSMFKKNPEEYLKSHAVMPQLYELAVTILVAKYAIDYEKWNLEDKKERHAYTDPKLEAGHKPMPTSYVKDGLYMYPHQVKVDNYLVNNEPKKAVLAVDAGGGKTFLIIKYILNMMEKGKWHRPLIVCPGTLLRNYVEECADLFEGKVNCVAIYSWLFNKRFKRFDNILKNAPPNTIVVVSFDFLKGKMKEIPYGTSVVRVGKNAEWIRKFGFDAAIIDESHFLRNESARTFSAQRVLSDIPNTTLATGTFVTKDIRDVVNQMRLIDPSVFENEDKFRQEYSAVDDSGRALKWKSNAEEEVASKISKHCTYIKVSKKEWACLLPHPVENFYFTDMNPVQRGLYQSILNETLEEIKAAMHKKKSLRKVLETSEQNEEDTETDDLELEAMLKPYLARLERFLTAPGLDQAGSKILQGKDRAGPKVAMVIKILERHLFGEHADDDEFKTFPQKGKIPGKILIYTSYHNSAQMIYESLPERLKKMTLYYTAKNKVADLARFNRDDSIKVMVGVENSLNTGQNLQISTRIIRIESVWTPGVLEQGKSRIERPDPKNLAGGERKNIYLDWVCVDRSIDVTKTARLTSKLLSKAKFDEQKNPSYAELKSLPIISMSLESLRNVNDFQTSLLEYLQEYSKLKAIDKKETDEYRMRQGKDFKLQPVPLNKKGILGQAHILGVPYIKDMKLPFMDKMNLQPYQDYVQDNSDEGTEEFDGKGLLVHTEFGDGVIIQNLRGNGVKVKRRIDGNVIRADKSRIFVILKKQEEPITQQLVTDIGQDLLKTGDEAIVRIPFEKIKPKDLLPLKEDIGEENEENDNEEEERKTLTPKQKVVRELEETEDQIDDNEEVVETQKQHRPIPRLKLKPGQVAVYPIIVNSLPALGIDDVSRTVSSGLLKKLGFQNPGQYIYAEIRTKQKMQELLQKILKAFTVSDYHKGSLLKILRAYNTGKAKLYNAEIGNNTKIHNFYFDQYKNRKVGTVAPYFIDYDGIPFLILKLRGQPSARQVPLKAKVSGVVWKVAKNGDWIRFCKNKNEMKLVLDHLKKSTKIVNYKECLEEINKIKIASPITLPHRKNEQVSPDILEKK